MNDQFPSGSLNARMHGFLNINKPPGMTSRDVVNRVSRLVGRDVKCGHAGTLDPIATGVLVVCLGKATKLVPLIHEHLKSYRGRFLLGKQSDTDDIEGEIVDVNLPELTNDDMERQLPKFTGEIEQIPPAYSAIKIQGERAYKAARRGQQIEMPSRTVTISQLTLSHFSPKEFEIEVTCGTGTYLRSLGRDLARAVSTEAVMSSLVRTSIGPFCIDEAIELDSLDRHNIQHLLLSPLSGLPHLQQTLLNDDQCRRVRLGQKIEVGAADSYGDCLAAVDQSSRLVAIAEVSHSLLHPRIVFPPVDF